MKVDVEGFEHRALEGARGVLERGHPKKLFLEVHPPAMREYGGDVHEVLSLLESYGYGWDLIEGHRDENSERRDVEPGDLEDVDNAMLVVER